MAVDEVRSYATLMCGMKRMTNVCRLNITQTLVSASKSGKGGQVSDMEMRKWANAMAQKTKPGARPISSFKDPSLSTGVFLLDVLEGLRPGIVDPQLVLNVSQDGDYEERRQNGMRAFIPSS